MGLGEASPDLEKRGLSSVTAECPGFEVWRTGSGRHWDDDGEICLKELGCLGALLNSVTLRCLDCPGGGTGLKEQGQSKPRPVMELLGNTKNPPNGWGDGSV